MSIVQFFEPTVGATVEVDEIEELAKGTLIVGDGSGAPTALAVGTDGFFLVADSTQPEGVKWAASTAGETNTASNGGGTGVGVWDSKSGVDLVFRNLVAASTKITIALDSLNKEIDIDVDPSQISTSSLNNDEAWASGDLLAANNLNDLGDAATARTNLGLGSLAVLSSINDGNWSGTDLAVLNGGTGASDAATARTNLGLAIGSDVQGYDAGLASIAGLTTVADRMIYTTASDTYAVATLTSFARTVLDDADAGTARATLAAAAIAGQVFTGEISFSGTSHYGLKVSSLTTAERDALTPAAGYIIYNTTTGTLQGYGSAWNNLVGGDVTGPGSSTDNTLVRFDGTSGALIQGSGIVIDDSDNVSGVSSLDIDGASGIIFTLTGSLISASATAGQVGIGTSSVNEKLTVNGAVSLAEISAPSNTAGFGKLYVKSSDSLAYFQNDAGTEFLLSLSTATATTEGKVELATTAEINTGTDTSRAITPDALAGSDLGTKSFSIIQFASDEAVATGDGTIGFGVPSEMNGMNIVNATAYVHTQGVTGTTDVQLRRRRSGTDVDVLSTKITVGAEYFAQDGVINGANDDLATGDMIFADVDAVHSGTAPNGLTITITCRKP